MRKLLNHKYWKHLGIGFIAAILLAVILINLGVAGGVVWLRGDSGQKWVQSRLNMLTEQSGYEIEFSHFSYSFPQGLKISEIRISDETGIVAELDALTLTPKILPLAARHAGVSVNAGTLALHRLPEETKREEPAERDQPEGLQPFALPDLYFTRFSVNDLYIERLDVREEVFGRAMILSPDLYSSVVLGDQVEMEFDLSLGREDKSLSLPRRIQMQAALDPQTLEAELSALNITHADYHLNANGTADLEKDGELSLKIDGGSDDLKTLVAQGGTFDFSGVIGGTLSRPSVNLDGAVLLENLKARGLDEIDFAIHMEDPANVQGGHITLSSAYNDKPLQIDTDIKRTNNVLRFENFKGSAPEIILNGQAVMDMETNLLDGSLDIQIDDLAHYSKLAGFALDGSGTIDLNLSTQDGTQALNADANLRALRYQDVSADMLRVSANLPDIKNIWPTRLDIQAQSLSLSPDMKLSKASVVLSDQGEDVYTLNTEMNGFVMKPFVLSGDANISGIRNQRPAVEGMDFDVRYGGSDVAITGAAFLDTLDVNAALQNFKLSSVPANIPVALREVTMSGDIALSGTPSAPIIQADITSNPFAPVEGTSFVLSAQGGYKDGQASVDINAQGDRIDRFDGSAALPVRFSLYPFLFDLPDDGGMDGMLNIDARAGQIMPLLLPPGHDLNGDMTLSAALSGNPADPQITGTLDFTDGTYVYEKYGAGLYELELQANLAKDHLRIESIRAVDKEQGRLKGSGRYDFRNRPETQIDVELENFHLVDSQRANGYISSDLRLQGQTEGYMLSGEIKPGRFDVAIPERFQTSIPQLNVVEKKEEDPGGDSFQQFALDLTVQAENQIFVRGWGLDAEFGGALDITGSLDEPLVNGQLSSQRGRYEEFGRRFILERAQLRFQGKIPPSPYLDIVATTDVSDITASVNLSGPFNEPDIALSSVPALPEDEVMSHVLFGRDTSTITPFQAIQLKNTLDRFSGRGGGFDPLGTLRSVTGLDDIRIDQDAEEGPSVGVGKYLTDKVYMELEQGAGEASGAASLQIEVSPNIDVETEIGQDAQAGAGVLWHWDY